MDINREELRIYEFDNKGQRVMVKSLESHKRAFLRFTNKTTRPVDIWWRDFKGMRVHYVRLKPRTHFDVNSFLTHPWEFTDVTTKERYVIDNKPIFRPPIEIGGKMFRMNWNITIGVRTLRQTALIALAKRNKDPSIASALDLPLVLAKELQETIKIYNSPIESSRTR